jgi:hypothetical protein
VAVGEVAVVLVGELVTVDVEMAAVVVVTAFVAVGVGTSCEGRDVIFASSLVPRLHIWDMHLQN